MDKSNTNYSLNSLPTEISRMIFSRLNANELLCLSCVSKSLLKTTSHNFYWEPLCKYKFGKSVLGTKHTNWTWKAFYLYTPKQHLKTGFQGRKKIKVVWSPYKDIRLRNNDEEYGIVTQLLGDSRVTVRCFDDVTRKCTISGKLRCGRGKKNLRKKDSRKIEVDDIVLVALRSFATHDDKGDIIHHYNEQHAKMIKTFPEFKTRKFEPNPVHTELFVPPRLSGYQFVPLK